MSENSIMHYTELDQSTADELRASFIEKYTDKKLPHYRKTLGQGRHFDGMRYNGFIWEVLKTENCRKVTRGEAIALLETIGKVYVMWDMRTMEKVAREFHYKKPTDTVIEVEGVELSAQLRHDFTSPAEERSFLPDDIYVFDKTLGWYITFTIEIDSETNNPMCLTNLEESEHSEINCNEENAMTNEQNIIGTNPQENLPPEAKPFETMLKIAKEAAQSEGVSQVCILELDNQKIYTLPLGCPLSETSLVYIKNFLDDIYKKHPNVTVVRLICMWADGRCDLAGHELRNRLYLKNKKNMNARILLSEAGGYTVKPLSEFMHKLDMSRLDGLGEEYFGISRVKLREFDLSVAYKGTKDNAYAARESKRCGCYICKRIFTPDGITDYSDDGKTALCPHCITPTVVTEESGNFISVRFLREVNERYGTSDSKRDAEIPTVHRPEDFAALVAQGSGRAVIWLREEKNKTPFIPIIKKAAMEEQRWEMQCEEPHGELVAMLICELDDPASFVESLCEDAPEYSGDFSHHDYEQFLTTLSVLVQNGHSMPRDVIKRYYCEKLNLALNNTDKDIGVDPEYEYGITLEAALKTAAVDFKVMMRDFGRLIQSGYDGWEANYIFDKYLSEHPEYERDEENEDEYTSAMVDSLEKFRAESVKIREKNEAERRNQKSVDDIIRSLKDGEAISIRDSLTLRKSVLSESEKEELFRLALSTDNAETKFGIYRSLSSVRDTKALLEEVKKLEYAIYPNENGKRHGYITSAAHRAIILLAHSYKGQPEIREYAEELRRKSAPFVERYTLEMSILLRDDPEALVEYVENIPVRGPSSWHSVHLEVIDMWEAGEKLDEKLLYHIYNTSLCASCRLRAVELMIESCTITPEIIRSGFYDSKAEIRERVKNYIPKHGEMTVEQKIRYIMQSYENGESTAWQFVSDLSREYYADNDGTLMREADAVIRDLAELAERFSPFEDDCKTSPHFIKEADLKYAAHKSFKKLCRVYHTDTLWDIKKENLNE